MSELLSSSKYFTDTYGPRSLDLELPTSEPHSSKWFGSAYTLLDSLRRWILGNWECVQTTWTQTFLYDILDPLYSAHGNNWFCSTVNCMSLHKWLQSATWLVWQYSARRLDPWGPTPLTPNEWYQKAVVELDSALNKWMDALPDHCRHTLIISLVCTLTVTSEIWPSSRKQCIRSPVSNALYGILLGSYTTTSVSECVDNTSAETDMNP